MARRSSPLVAALAVAIVGAITWSYLVDDAFIVARYARHLARSDGWAMNPGRPSDGITGPLWLLPIALGEWLGLDAPTLQRVLGLAASALAVGLVVRDRERVGASGEAWLAASLLAVQATFGIWGGAGLETGFATLAMVLLARRLWASPSTIGRRLSIAAAFALPWLRPELSVAGAVIGGGLALGARPDVAAEPAEVDPSDRWPLAALLAGGAAVLVFRLVAFGHLLPLAATAKLGSIADGLRYGGIAVLLTTGLGGIYLVVRATTPPPASGLRARALAVALGAHLIAVAISGGDWMPGHRLVMPVLPLYAVVAAQGFQRLRGGVRWLAMALAWGVPLTAGALQIVAAEAAGDLRLSRGPAVAEAVRGRGPVALVDIGHVGWSAGVEVVDLGGITDPTIAAAPGGHLAKRVPLGYLVERDPRTILLHSAVEPGVDPHGQLTHLAGYAVERHLAALPWVRAHFRVGAVIPYAKGYLYVRLDRVGSEGDD